MRKQLQIKVHKIIFLTIIVVVLVGFYVQAASAATSDMPLGGMSQALERYYDSGQALCEDDAELLAEAMYHENYCNGELAMLLTGSVILNRAAAEDYPDTIQGVLYDTQGGYRQYSTTDKFFTMSIPGKVYRLARQLLIFGSAAPADVIYQSMRRQGSGVYRIINGEYFCRR